MEQNCNSSVTPKEFFDDSLYSELVKIHLEDAFSFCKDLLDNELVTQKKSSTILLETKLIEEDLYHHTTEMLGEKKSIEKDELILCHKDNEDSLLNHVESDLSDSDNYQPTPKKMKITEYIPLETKIKVLKLAKEHPNWRLETLQRKGSRSLKKKSDLKKWEKDVISGGTSIDKYAIIDSCTYDRFMKAQDEFLQVTTRNLQEWALDAASQFQSPSFIFKASNTWVKRFKKKYGIQQQNGFLCLNMPRMKRRSARTISLRNKARRARKIADLATEPDDKLGDSVENEQNNQCNSNLKSTKEKCYSCNLCSKEFLSFTSLVVHKYKFCKMRLARINLFKKLIKLKFFVKRNYQCNLCERNYFNKLCLKNHLFMHIDEKPFRCKICHKSFYIKSYLQKHMKLHIEENSLQNKICKRNFNLDSNLDGKHNEENKLHHCQICKKNFQTELAVIMHEISHFENNFHCDICDKYFKFRSLFERHQASHSEERPFQCEFCEKNFKTQTRLTTHLRIHAEYKPFQCKVCQKNFKQISKLKEHEKCHPKSFQCVDCNMNFETRLQLVAHQKIHPEQKPFQCNLCNKSFKKLSNLKIHQANHSQEGTLQCDVCNKIFNKKKLLKHHLIRHSQERPYNCNICTKSFKSMQELKRHQTCHSQARPFKCNICNSSFKIKQLLKIHSLCHSEVRPFQCDLCDKSFKSKLQLRKHTTRHSQARPFQCDLCDKSFKNKSDLNKHKPRHSEARPFECNLCNKFFKSKRNLRLHLIRHIGFSV